MQVRKCAHCGESACIPLRDWGKSVLWGLVQTRSIQRTDWVCQSCGTSFTLFPHPRLRAVFGGIPASAMLMVAGVMLAGGLTVSDFGPGARLGLAGGGLLLGSLSVAALVHFSRSAWNAWRNPLLPDTPAVLLHYVPTEPTRRCRCGAEVPLHKVVYRTANHIPTGTDYLYACTTCGREFTLTDSWGLVFAVLALGLFSGLTLLFVFHPPGGMGPLEGGTPLCLGVYGLAALLALVKLLMGSLSHWWLFPVVSKGGVVPYRGGPD